MGSNPDPDPNLPRILCLHGGGVSAMIFKIQTRRIMYALRNHFKFVFVSAPYESGPGPGILPVFKDCGPYYRWMKQEDEDHAPGQREVRKILKEAIAADGGKFVGVLGFSQGGRQSAGLLADQQEGRNEGMPEFKFGVILCASYPPISLSASEKPYESTGKDHHGPFIEPTADQMIHIPTVHVLGLQDPHLEKGQRLSKFFDNKILFEYDMGHNQPGAAGDTTSPKGASTEIAEAILKLNGTPIKLGGPGGTDTPQTPEPEVVNRSSAAA